MENKPTRTTGYYLSTTISYIMHPFLMPTWFLVILFTTGVIPTFLPPAIRNYLFMVFSINTLLVPIIGVVLMRAFGIIDNYSLSTRADRTLPMLIVAICYGLCAWMLSSLPMMMLLQKVMWAAMLCTIFALCVNLGWKISLHMTSAGAIVGAVLVLLVAGYNDMVWVFCGTLVMAGALGTARLYLGKHTPAQIAGGFFGGLVISFLVMLLWPF